MQHTVARERSPDAQMSSTYRTGAPRGFPDGHPFTNRIVAAPRTYFLLLLVMPCLAAFRAFSNGYHFDTDIASYRISKNHEVQSKHLAFETALAHTKTYKHHGPNQNNRRRRRAENLKEYVRVPSQELFARFSRRPSSREIVYTTR